MHKTLPDTIGQWHYKPSGDYTQIFRYLKTIYTEVRRKISFPVTIPEIHRIYNSHLTPAYREKMPQSCPELHSLDTVNIDRLLEHHVLSPLTTKNFMALTKKIDIIITRFLANMTILPEIDLHEQGILAYITEHTAQNDEALLRYLRTVSRLEFDGKEMTYSMLNQKLPAVFRVLQHAQHALYNKYGCPDYYLKEKETIKQATVKLIFSELVIWNEMLMYKITKSLKRGVAAALKEFKDVYEDQLAELYARDPKALNYIKSFAFIKDNLLNILSGRVEKELGEAPTEVFIYQSEKEIHLALEKSIVADRLYKTVLQDSATLKSTVFTELKGLFQEFFSGEINPTIFDLKTMGGVDNVRTVIKIALLTDYVEYHELRYDLYFEILERVYYGFIVDCAARDPEIEEIWRLVSTKESYQANRGALDSMLTREKEKWDQEADLHVNLYALMSVFLAFNAVPAENMSSRYTNHLRCMLKCVFRNFQNGRYRFTNFQVLCALESLIIEYKTEMRSRSLLRSDTLPLQRELMEKIRKTSINSYEQQETYRKQLASLDIKISSGITRPTKFIFEKLSDPKVKSKSIIVCISGFTSEASTKSNDWKAISAAYPNTEVMALHWRSNTMNAIVESAAAELDLVMKAEEQARFSFVLPTLTFGKLAYKAFKAVTSDQWGTTYREAITTGIYLAHVLAETELFKDYVISLLGFSLGTMVIMNCIWELERMDRHDVIYDVLLMGGVINAGDFNQGAMSVIGHKLINCYCENDWVLKVILRCADFGANPVGLSPLWSPNRKVENVNLTDQVDGHTYYRQNLVDIMARIDFNEDFRYMLEENSS